MKDIAHMFSYMIDYVNLKTKSIFVRLLNTESQLRKKSIFRVRASSARTVTFLEIS
jgi:hypothetical protein